MAMLQNFLFVRDLIVKNANHLNYVFILSSNYKSNITNTSYPVKLNYFFLEK